MFLLCFVLLLAGGAVPAHAQTSDDLALVFTASLRREVARYAEIVKAAPNPQLHQDNVATDKRRRFRAFTVVDSSRSTVKYPDRIFFTDTRTGETFEVRGLPEPHRPYDSLSFRGSVLQFYRWASPHHGVRYRLDVRRKKFVAAEAFIEADYVELQKKASKRL